MDIENQRSLPLQTFRTERTAIESYFHAGYSYTSICKFLEVYHDIPIALRTLKRKIKRYGLSRIDHTPLEEIYNRIVQLLNGPGKQMGYRSIHSILRTNFKMSVKRETVRRILLFLDPIGVSNRRQHRLQRRTYLSRGPNNTWHVDGYDKLKRYGFGISGCIDGYSRRIIWLRCAHSNNDPAIIASYYLDSVKELGYCPEKVRTDCGTENGILAAMQCQHIGNDMAHSYGSSTSNQRIECWWSTFRRNYSQWWIDLFQDLCDSNILNVDIKYHKECLRYSFMDLMRTELNNVAYLWNCHRIRPSANARCPSGIPDQLYFVPPDDAENCKHEIQDVL